MAPVLDLKMTLETIMGNLRDGYNQLEPGTMLHADQLMAAQVQDANLRTQSYYVADGPLYSLEDRKKTPTLWLTREADNLVLRHLNDEVNSSYEQLIKTHNYRPNPEEALAAMNAKGTLRVDLTKLRLHGDEAEWRYLEIDTQKYDKLKPEERKLAERWYGRGKAFGTAMKTLKDAGISTTKVYVLNPGYVSQEAKKDPIGRAAWRYGFVSVAGSVAYVRSVFIHVGVRGVRLGEARSAAPKIQGVPVAPAAAPEIRLPSMEEMLQYSTPFVAEVNRAQFEEGLRNLYKQ